MVQGIRVPGFVEIRHLSELSRMSLKMRFNIDVYNNLVVICSITYMSFYHSLGMIGSELANKESSQSI